MNSAAFAATDHLYRLGEFQEIDYHHAQHADFDRFCGLARRLRRELKERDLTEDEHWAAFYRVVQAYRFDHLLTPLSFDAPSVSPRMSDEEIARWFRRNQSAFPEFSKLSSELTGLIAALRKSSVAPLLDLLEALAGNGQEIGAVVVRDSRLVLPTREALLSRPRTSTIRALSGLSLRRVDALYDRLFVIGSPRWFPPFVFSATRAARVSVLAYTWQRDRWQPEPAFRASIASPRHGEEIGIREESDDDGPPMVDWGAVERHATAVLTDDREVEEYNEIAEARLALLQGGHAVFIEAGAKRSLVIDLDEDDRGRVKRVDANDVEPGMYVLLRTEGGGDYIVPLADQILGERAGRLRADQMYWKSLLASLVRRRSLAGAVGELAALGCARADEGNVRRWISRRNIRTQDRSDFDAIMQLVGLADEADVYWQNMGEIRSAHQRAGRLIADQLVDQVRQADLTTLSEDGRMDFTLPGATGGRLTAYRVENVAPETTIVPVSQLNRPLLWGT